MGSTDASKSERDRDGCEKDLASNQSTIMILEKVLIEKELEVPKIPEIPDDTVPSEKGYYHGVYIILHFSNEGSSDRK